MRKRVFLMILIGVLWCLLGNSISSYAASIESLEGKEFMVFMWCDDDAGDYCDEAELVTEVFMFEDDDRFYCLLVKNLSLLKLPGLLRKVYSGKPIKTTSYLFLHYARNIEIEGNYKNPDVEFDGDPAGFLPCRVGPVEDRLELIS